MDRAAVSKHKKSGSAINQSALFILNLFSN